MTASGRRSSPLLNNLVRNLQTIRNLGELEPYDSNKFGHYLQCHEQVGEVIGALESLELDDKWEFYIQEDYNYFNFGHTTGVAFPYNNNDPIIHFDRFNKRFSNNGFE